MVTPRRKMTGLPDIPGDDFGTLCKKKIGQLLER